MANALVLGGGAPNLTLMAGAVAALDDAGIKFDIVSTTGAGMLIGLLYAAPKGMSRKAALENTVNMGVHDAIYRLFPVNFKVFHKPGVLAEIYTKFWQIAAENRTAIEAPIGVLRDQWFNMLSASPVLAPWADVWMKTFGVFSSPGTKGGDIQRFFDDWAALVLATFCPGDLNPASLGMCQPAPFVEQAVDFSKLREFAGEFYMSAYCLETDSMEIFEKKDITLQHFQAALAFPLIYAPFKMNGRTYIEGAAKDTLSFEGLFEQRKDYPEHIDTIVVCDVLGLDDVITEPRSLYDAWVKSIIVPLTANATDDMKLFERHLQEKETRDKYFKGEAPHVIKIDFSTQIKSMNYNWSNMFDWSYSNLSALYDAGRRAGRKASESAHLGKYKEKKPPRAGKSPAA